MDFDQALRISRGNLFNGMTPDDAKKLIRELAMVLHPDHAPADRKDEATEVFARIYGLYQAYVDPSASPDITIHTAKHSYRLGAQAAFGTVGVLYHAEMLSENNKRVLIKFPQSPNDNDLMETEGRFFDALEEADHYDQYYALFPKRLDAFTHHDTEGIQRRCNVFEPASVLAGAPFFTLQQILDQPAYVHGIAGRNCAWIFRRILAAIGFVHREGWVNNAITPDNILIEPSQHCVVICGWTYATPIDQPMKAYNSNSLAYYPPEVAIDHKPVAGPTTDLYMAAEVLRRMGGKNIPTRMQRFAKGCAQIRVKDRPQDGWGLLKEFEEMLYDLYGAPKFNVMVLPAGTKPSVTSLHQQVKDT
jgi:serine/threonine protein kinase